MHQQQVSAEMPVSGIVSKSIFDDFGSINYTEEDKSNTVTFDLDNNIRMQAKIGDTNRLLNIILDARREFANEQNKDINYADLRARVSMSAWLGHGSLHNGFAEEYGRIDNTIYDLTDLPPVVKIKSKPKEKPHKHSYMESYWGDVYCLCGQRTSKDKVDSFIPLMQKHRNVHQCTESCNHTIPRRLMPTTRCTNCGKMNCVCGTHKLTTAQYMKAVMANGHGTLITKPIF